MSTRAYILIETIAGTSRDVAFELSSVAGVTEVDRITGPYDVVAMIETEDLPAMGDLTTRNIHAIPGVVRSQTCLIF